MITRGRDEWLDGAILDAAIEDFVKRYAPSVDRNDDGRSCYENAQFHAALHNLVRLIYSEATKPLLKHITDLSKSMTMPFILNKEPKP